MGRVTASAVTAVAAVGGGAAARSENGTAASTKSTKSTEKERNTKTTRAASTAASDASWVAPPALQQVVMHLALLVALSAVVLAHVVVAAEGVVTHMSVHRCCVHGTKEG
jgi:hypothetical protein